jgi:hypothetical protein
MLCHDDLIKSGDLVQIVSRQEADANTRIYEDWLAWDPSLQGKIAIALTESLMNTNHVRIFCDGKEIWTSKHFLKKV